MRRRFTREQMRKAWETKAYEHADKAVGGRSIRRSKARAKRWLDAWGDFVSGAKFAARLAKATPKVSKDD